MNTTFEHCVVHCLDDLLRAAMRLTSSRAEAEDLVQDAMLKAWSVRESYREGTNPRAWVYRILRNNFISALRHRQVERGWVEDAMQGLPVADSLEGLAMASELNSEIAAAMADLPEDFRTVVRLVDVDELTYREAATTLGCPVGTVMSRLHRGRSVLKHRLKHHCAPQKQRYVPQHSSRQSSPLQGSPLQRGAAVM